MKKLLLFICAALMFFGCGKEGAGDELIIGPAPTGKVTWATIVKTYPFLWTAFLYLTGKSRIASTKSSAA